jgi:glycosyltransferase involved in cell wall biosynthesis
MSTKAQLRKWIVRGRLRILGRPLYALAIASELAAERVLDFIQPPDRNLEQTLVERDLTAVIKTFERPKTLHRLLASIKRKYPRLRTIVVDDSRSPSNVSGVQTIIMPYDSGVSAGRNEGLRHVLTKYALFLDDDFVFYRHTNLETALAIMENYPQIDIMGGEVIYLPSFKTADYSRADLFPSDAKATMPAGSYIGGLPVYDKVANFFTGHSP